MTNDNCFNNYEQLIDLRDVQWKFLKQRDEGKNFRGSCANEDVQALLWIFIGCTDFTATWGFFSAAEWFKLSKMSIRKIKETKKHWRIEEIKKQIKI